MAKGLPFGLARMRPRSEGLHLGLPQVEHWDWRACAQGAAESVRRAHGRQWSEGTAFHWRPMGGRSVAERQYLRRDAWLSETKHLRPGIKDGLPVTEAEAKAAELGQRIARLIGEAAPPQ